VSQWESAVALESDDPRSDTVIGTALRRACGASCARLLYWKSVTFSFGLHSLKKSADHMYSL